MTPAERRAAIESLQSIIDAERFKLAIRTDDEDLVVCRECESTHVVKRGKDGFGRQRYLCRDCGKSFVATSNTIVSGTRKELAVWMHYIECMMQSMSIRKTTEVCAIHRNTAFYWRHKILDALQNVAKAVEIGGIVEMNETFFPVSCKGTTARTPTSSFRGKFTGSARRLRSAVCQRSRSVLPSP